MCVCVCVCVLWYVLLGPCWWRPSLNWNPPELSPFSYIANTTVLEFHIGPPPPAPGPLLASFGPLQAALRGYDSEARLILPDREIRRRWWPLRTGRALFCSAIKTKSKKGCICTRPWMPKGSGDVEDPTFFRTSLHTWRLGCKPHTPATLYPQKYLLVDYSFILEAE
jgi:hypothetical protein